MENAADLGDGISVYDKPAAAGEPKARLAVSRKSGHWFDSWDSNPAACKGHHALTLAQEYRGLQHSCRPLS
jgi:hypothetical protein